MSVIPYSWAHVLRFENNRNIKYANWFAFYPWLVDNKYEGLVMSSMAQTGWHEVKALQAQPHPEFRTCTSNREWSTGPSWRLC